MADLIGTLVAAIVELIAAAVQLSMHLVAMVLESLGFAAGRLSKKPESGERRFSMKRLTVALAPLAILVAFVAGAMKFIAWRADVSRARQHETQNLIEDHVDRLVGQVDQEGHLVQHPVEVLDAQDAWGNPLRVAYEKSLLQQIVTVRSDGPDETSDTLDDLASTRRILRPKQDATKDALDKAADAVRTRLKRD